MLGCLTYRYSFSHLVGDIGCPEKCCYSYSDLFQWIKQRANVKSQSIHVMLWTVYPAILGSLGSYCIFFLFLVIAVQLQIVSPLTQTFPAAAVLCDCRKKNVSNLKHQWLPGFGVSPSEGIKWASSFCSRRSSVLLVEIHLKGGRDTDYCSDGRYKTCFFSNRRDVFFFLDWRNLTVTMRVCSLGFTAITLWEMLGITWHRKASENAFQHCFTR